MYILHLSFSQGSIKYRAIGDFQATFYFGVDENTGQIFVKNDLKQDLLNTYVVCII